MNAIRLKVEEKLSVSDLLSEEQVRDILHSPFPPTVTDTNRIATCLLAYMTAPDEHDQELDDLRMRVATAEVDAEKIRASRQRMANIVGEMAGVLESLVRAGESASRVGHVADRLRREIAKEIPG